MSVNFSPFEIGRRALNAQQFGINVTGQNIANVNTRGYTRQSVQLAELAPTSFNDYALGTGVTVESVQAFRDRFVEARIQTELGIAGRLNAERDSLAPVEVALTGGENGGLQKALEGFFGAFRDLEANPGSVPLRSIVAQKAVNLTNSFQATAERVKDIRSSIDSQLRSNVIRVNNLSEQIASYNAEIRDSENLGGNASALRDQRNELVNEIAELTGARSTENEDGTITLYIGEGRPLVTGTTAYKLETQTSPPNGLTTLTIEGDPAVFDEGLIRGFQNAIAETNEQLAGLDGLAEQLVTRVNALHTGGTDLDNNPGVEFFSTANVPITATNISINTAIQTNPNLVVASPLAQPAQSGTVAGEIANLLTDTNTVVGSRTGSYGSIFGSLVSQAGEQIRVAENGLQTQAAIIAQASAQREAVSGVSLDEEAINLLQYQRAYEAAARFIRVADEMTQTILSLAQ